jgi:hypothetical protein
VHLSGHGGTNDGIVGVEKKYLEETAPSFVQALTEQGFVLSHPNVLERQRKLLNQ